MPPAAAVKAVSSCLLELDQRPAKILGVQEQDQLAVGAHPGLAVAKYASAVTSASLGAVTDANLKL